MAIVVDEARPATVQVTRAMSEFTQPTPRTMDHSFDILASSVETHVTARGDVVPWVGVDNTGDTAAPVVDDDAFWLPST